jgi:hypothetical protein
MLSGVEWITTRDPQTLRGMLDVDGSAHDPFSTAVKTKDTQMPYVEVGDFTRPPSLPQAGGPAYRGSVRSIRKMVSPSFMYPGARLSRA